jgi:hypothetical protein
MIRMASDNNGDDVKEYKKYQSRKWRLVIIVMVIATLGLFVPPLLSLWVFKASKALFLITGTEWVSVITLIVAAYFGANVWQKHVERRAIGGGMMPFGDYGGISGVEVIEETSGINARGTAPTFEETVQPDEEGEA